MLGTFAGPAAGAGVGLGVGYLTRSKAWGAGTGAAAGAGIGAMFGGPIGAGIGAGVGAIGGLIGGMLGGQKEHKQVNDLRDAFIGAAGGIDQLRDTAHEAGLTLDKLLNAKKVSEFEAAVRGLEPALAAVAKEAEVAQRYALTFADFGAGTPERAKRLDADVAALTGDFKTLIALGVEHDIAVRRVGAAYVDLAVAAVQAGEEIPAAMAPVLRDLAEMGALTEAQAAALLGMTDAAGPSWQEMTSAAERYGIALDQLGQRYQQLKINDVAEAFAKDFDLLQEGGVDTSVLFEGMKEEISTIVQEAIKYGLTIPKSMEPVITSMMEQGYVTNEAGDALRDVAAIKFADPVISEVDKLILKLDELIATLTTKLAPAFASIPANFDWSGYNEFAAQQAAHPSLTPATVPDAAYQPGTLIPMKDGGTGSVSRATSFMAGEAGTEEFAFSGAGRTFGRLEMNGVERRLDLLRQDLVDERNARIRTAQRSRIDQANVLLTRAR
jgi:hypothetical protein